MRLLFNYNSLFFILIDNEYCPALYFHAIEPGTLKMKNKFYKNNHKCNKSYSGNLDSSFFLSYIN